MCEGQLRVLRENRFDVREGFLRPLEALQDQGERVAHRDVLRCQRDPALKQADRLLELALFL